MVDAIFWLQWCYLANKRQMIYKRPLVSDVYDVLKWAMFTRRIIFRLTYFLIHITK